MITPQGLRWVMVAIAALAMSACKTPLPTKTVSKIAKVDISESVQPLAQPQNEQAQGEQALNGHSQTEPNQQNAQRNNDVALVQFEGELPYCPEPAIAAQGMPSGAYPAPQIPATMPYGYQYPPAYPGAMLPPVAVTGAPQPLGPAVNRYQGDPYGQWAPPQQRGIWPRQEYVFDGGDRNRGVAVNADWAIRGLDSEDTIAHYDTPDGRVLVEPSNRVPIYAPRFAAVRQLSGMEYQKGQVKLTSARVRWLAAQGEKTRVPTTVIQPTEVRGANGLHVPSNLSERTKSLNLATGIHLSEYDGDFGVHEDFQIFHSGKFDGEEKGRLVQYQEAAAAWTDKQTSQVLFDADTATVEVGSTAAQAVYINSKVKTNPRLRLVKAASKRSALPGEIVEFSLRFDNVGDEVIGNVTIIDNLTSRLEYIEGSGQCSVDAEMFGNPNDGDSLILRWEIKEPLNPGEGGLIRFKCRVR